MALKTSNKNRKKVIDPRTTDIQTNQYAVGNIGTLIFAGLFVLLVMALIV